MAADHGYRRKPRNNRVLRERPLVILATEGKNKTETKYFGDLARDLDKFSLVFAPGNETDPEGIVSQAKKAKKKYDYDPKRGDLIFCLIDTDFDASKNAQLHRALKDARGNDIQIILSSPCFEIWFLCHYTRSTKKYNSYRDVASALSAHLQFEYSKNLQNMYSVTKDKICDAIKNAKFLEEACIRAGYERYTASFSPSTDVYHIVEQLLDNT